MASSSRAALLTVLLLSACGSGSISELVSTLSLGSDDLPTPWPPVAGERYPDLELRDFRGEPVRLSDFAGKLLLIEPIGMT